MRNMLIHFTFADFLCNIISLSVLPKHLQQSSIIISCIRVCFISSFRQSIKGLACGWQNAEYPIQQNHSYVYMRAIRFSKNRDILPRYSL